MDPAPSSIGPRGRGVTPESRPYDLDRIARFVGTVLIFLALFFLLRTLADVLVPFAIALLLAYLLNPIVEVFERRLHSRGLAVLATLVGSVGFLVLLSWLGARYVGGEVRQMTRFLEELRTAGTPAYENVQAFVRDLNGYPWIQEAIQAGRDRLRELDVQDLLVDAGQTLAPRLLGLVGGLVGVIGGVLRFLLGLTVVLIVLLYLVFLLVDFPRVRESWKDLLPPRYREGVVTFLDEFASTMRVYFRGQFVVACVVGVLFAIGFRLVGIQLAVLLGLAVGLLNMIPYLQIVAIVPAGLLAVLHAVETDASVWTSLLWVGLVFVVVQVIQDAVLVPRILGKSTGLRPAVLLLGIFVWGKLLGFLGLVLAIPLTCLGVAYYTRWLESARARAASSG